MWMDVDVNEQKDLWAVQGIYPQEKTSWIVGEQ